MSKKITIPGPQGQQIAATITRHGDPDAPDTQKTLILMSHGFPGHKSANNDFLGDLEAMFSARGHDTLRFDYRGCGESDGREEDFTLREARADLECVQNWCLREGYSHFILIGEGLGASVAALSMGLNVKAFAMLWPVLEPKTYARHYLARAVSAPGGHPYSDLDGHRIGHDFIREMKETDLVKTLKEIYCPTLIMHGSEDQVVPPAQLDLARGFIPARRIEITVFHDGDHGLTAPAHRKAMLYHIQQFVQKYA